MRSMQNMESAYPIAGDIMCLKTVVEFVAFYVDFELRMRILPEPCSWG